MSVDRLRAFREVKSTENLEHVDKGAEIFTTIQDKERVYNDKKELITILKEALIIDFYATDEEKSEYNLFSAGDNTYVISPITDEPLVSAEYRNCQGIVVSGVRNDGTPIAFISHHNPDMFSEKEKFDQFNADLRGQIRDLSSQVEPGSIDVVSFGGDAYTVKEAGSGIHPDLTRADDYRIVAEVVNDIVKEELGFPMRIVEGPRTKPSFVKERHANDQLAIYDTKNHHLRILISGASRNSGKVIEVENLDSELKDLTSVESEEIKEEKKFWETVEELRKRKV